MCTPIYNPYMKKLLILPLLFLSFAQAVPAPSVCKNNNWFQILAKRKNDLEHEKQYGYSKPMIYCVLPNGKYYSPWALVDNNVEYRKLVQQYSGKSPSLKQIEEAKEKIKKDGYIILN